MGLRFRQSFQLFPGVRLNVSARGVSASFGVPGATINVSRRGVRGTAGLPGTGLSYTTMLAPAAGRAPPAASQGPGWPGQGAPGYVPVPASPAPAGGRKQAYRPVEGMREIGSKGVESLTSDSLLELRDMLIAARRQRAAVNDDLAEARTELRKLQTEFDKRSRSLFRMFYRRRIWALRDEHIPGVAAEIERLEAWDESTHVDMAFETSDEAQRAYAALVRAFEALRGCAAAWDVTSDRDTNRIVERTTASRVVARHPIRLDFASNDLVRFDGRAMRFENVNGEDILVYPGVAVMPRGDGMFALIDLRELEVTARTVSFVEDDRPPSDAQVVGHTWAKANKDGSPDRRFRDNYQIPICLYGQLAMSSASGVTEEYQVSQPDAAAAFATALAAYQAALSKGTAE